MVGRPIARHDHWQRLLDVVASIPHLMEQGSTDYVPLVGFLGHFGSGKSALINAIMGIEPNEHPPYRRASGRNPTDRDITLTTHFDHYCRTKEELFSPADKVGVVKGPQSSVMERMTLVDTPGLGDDPAERATIVRFLHLVHVLVLTVDGRRPFADTDRLDASRHCVQSIGRCTEDLFYYQRCRLFERPKGGFGNGLERS